MKWHGAWKLYCYFTAKHVGTLENKDISIMTPLWSQIIPWNVNWHGKSLWLVPKCQIYTGSNVKSFVTCTSMQASGR